MPRRAPSPFQSTVAKPSRFENFLKRNIVVIAICAPLLVIALLSFIFQR